LTAAIVQVLYVSTPAELTNVPSANFPVEAGQALTLALSAATQFAIFSVAFALIAAGLAEWLGLQGVGYWLGAGIGIAILGFIAQFSSEVPGQPTILNNYALQSYVTAGFFGGLVYWLIAGRWAGDSHEPVAVEEPAQRPRIIVEKERSEVKKGSLAERLALKRAASDAGSQAVAEKPAEGRGAAAPAPASTTSSVPITKPDAAKAAPPAPRPAEAGKQASAPAAKATTDAAPAAEQSNPAAAPPADPAKKA
jgi:hypothetical protein